MKRQSLREWIRANRAELDAAIRKACPNLRSLNDNDRADWIRNDEGLYLWAKGDGVRV